MKTVAISLLALLALVTGVQASAATQWTEGQHYFLIRPAFNVGAQPGKVIVTEVFSYACPACNVFQPVMSRLKAALPPNAELQYVPASFNTYEDWPMFQKAFYTAQALGIDKQAHEAMFGAVWTTGELGVIDEATHQARQPAPSIEDAARFYAKKTGVNASTFVARSRGMDVDMHARAANELVRACQVTGTPTIIVNGKYRVEPGKVGGGDQLIEVVKWLVAQETH